MLRQMDEKETKAIHDFLDETEETIKKLPNSDTALLTIQYAKHQRALLKLVDKYKKGDYDERN